MTEYAVILRYEKRVIVHVEAPDATTAAELALAQAPPNDRLSSLDVATRSDAEVVLHRAYDPDSGELVEERGQIRSPTPEAASEGAP